MGDEPMIKATCAFVSWSDLLGCIHNKVDTVLEHVRLWIETLLT